VPDTRVLLLGAASSDPLAAVLSRPGRVLTRTSDAEEAVSLAGTSNVIVLDVAPPPRSIADVCREIRATPELAEIPILAIATGDSVEERIRLLEAGADDVIARPVDDRELDARVEALDLRFRRSKELHPGIMVAATRRPGRRLVAVFSPKGGVGTTTVAVNLGLVLAARQPDQVALLDLGGGIGQVWTHLDLTPRVTLGDLLRDGHAQDDPAALAGYLTRHASGLRVLAAPAAPISVLPADQAGRLVETALAAVPTVVVDAGSRLEPGTEAILAQADDVLVVVTPEFTALKSVRMAFEHFAQIGLGIVEPRIVLNELFANEMLTASDIEGALGRGVTVRVPYDALLYQRAVNEGRPVYASAPRSAPSQQFELLGRVILGEDVPHDASTDGRKRRRGLFSRA
jgi:pilus assembly protein CpaE